MADIKKLAHEVYPYVVEMRRDFHRHPEASFEEFRTTRRIAEELDKMAQSGELSPSVLSHLEGSYRESFLQFIGRQGSTLLRNCGKAASKRKPTPRPTTLTPASPLTAGCTGRT